MKLIWKFHVMPMHLACCRHSIGNLNHTRPWVAQYSNLVHMKLTSTQELYKQQHFKLINKVLFKVLNRFPCKETPSLQRHLQRIYLACTQRAADTTYATWTTQDLELHSTGIYTKPTQHKSSTCSNNLNPFYKVLFKVLNQIPCKESSPYKGICFIGW